MLPMKRTLLGAFAATAIGFHLLGGAAQAQYPGTLGGLICDTGGVTAVMTNSNVGLTATLTDPAGQPIAGQVLAFTAQAGGTVISQGTATTNSNGVATFNLGVGANAGTIVLSAVGGSISCSSNVSSQTLVSEVLGSTFVPPVTGEAGMLGAGESTSTNTLLLIASGVITALAAGLIGVRNRILN